MDKPITHLREGFAGQRLIRVPAAAAVRARRLRLARGLYVTDIGHFPETRRHFVNRPGGSADCIFIYNARGRGWARIGRERFAVPAEHGLAIPAGIPHAYGADEAIPWEIHWFHFNGAEARAAVELFGRERGPVYLPAVEALGEAFEDVYRWTGMGFSDGALIAMSAALRRYLSLANVHRRAPGDRSRRVEERVLKAIAEMHARLAEDRTLAQWARGSGLSAPRFGALFRKQTGCSPMRYLGRLRLQKACELLDLTTLQVGEVGRAVGIEDPLYFCRMFKNGAGVSPREYRKRIIG